MPAALTSRRSALRSARKRQVGDDRIVIGRIDVPPMRGDRLLIERGEAAIKDPVDPLIGVPVKLWKVSAGPSGFATVSRASLRSVVSSVCASLSGPVLKSPVITNGTPGGSALIRDRISVAPLTRAGSSSSI